jgi:DNA helicase-2/ATP-dependent DNA helicase PcrA
MSGSPAEALLEGLNEQQRLAVVDGSPAVLVVAGAGSGKTRVLTHRIAHLLQSGQARPSEILAITFTNKAAAEMGARLSRLLGPVASSMWISTFHSACLRILRTHGERLSYRPGLGIYDDDDTLRVIRRILVELEIDPKRITPRTIRTKISHAKSSLLSAPDQMATATTPVDRHAAEVRLRYDERLRDANVVDFDDLIYETVRLFREHAEVTEQYRRRFRHVLVDEYQDTNRAQNELIGLLCGPGEVPGGVVFAVGDSDQSIYRFRGSDPANLFDFDSAFPGASSIVLEQNYRSTQTVLDAANAVISNNTRPRPKRLWTEAGGGAPIVVYAAEDENDEARFVADRVREYVAAGRSPAEIAVFYRTNSQSRPLEEELGRQRIGFRVVGGPRFYDRREIRDVLAYLRLLVNPYDAVSLQRVASAPKRGLGETSVNRLISAASSVQVSLLEALAKPELAGLSGAPARGARELADLLRRIDEARVGSTPSAAVEMVLEWSGYRAALAAEGGVEAEGRLVNLAELVQAAGTHDTLDGFLEQAALSSDADQADPDGGRVTLMTLHGAKGLEFPLVFLVGMEEGIFPHSRALVDPDELEEERRLCYVGITRAREALCLSFAAVRSQWGSANYNSPSRFLAEIPSELLVYSARRPNHPGFDHPRDVPGRARPGRGSSGGWEARARPGRDGSSGRFSRGSTPSGSRAGAWVPTAGSRLADSSSAIGLEVGDDVVHATFGEGVVTACRGDGDRRELTIRFSGGRERVFLATMAPLTRLDRSNRPS